MSGREIAGLRFDREPNRLPVHRARRAEEAARASARYQPGQDVDVLDKDGSRWIPGRVTEAFPSSAVVELLEHPAGKRFCHVVTERIRPRES